METLTTYTLDAVLMAVNYIIMMLQLGLGLTVLLAVLWAVAMSITVPCMVVKSIFTKNK